MSVPELRLAKGTSENVPWREDSQCKGPETACTLHPHVSYSLNIPIGHLRAPGAQSLWVLCHHSPCEVGHMTNHAISSYSYLVCPPCRLREGILGRDGLKDTVGRMESGAEV